MKGPLGTGRLAAFLRSFLIQGSWNYRTMVGGGFGFAMAPVLRRIHGGDAEALEESLRRYTGRFNSHPYMAGLALGACVRLEEEGAPPEVVERFKTALGGSLGGLGDRLVWAAWLPSCVLAGVVAVLAGAPVWIGVVLFLGVYNAGHLWLRIWSFRAGLARGRDVGRTVATLGIPRISERISLGGVLLLGVAAGLLLGGGVVPAPTHWGWRALAAAALVLGAVSGQRAWRPAMRGTVLVLAGLFLFGSLLTAS